MDNYTVIRAKRLIDSVDGEVINCPIVVVRNDDIIDVGTEDQVELPRQDDVKELFFEDETLLPGLIDSHVHLALGIRGSYEEMMRETDGIHLMSGITNANQALEAGITTIKEAGARNRVALDLREGWRRGLIRAPRLYVSGRPLTITGGHFYFCNDNEADGVDEVRKRVRQFIKEGVDLIKIMASGGGTGGTSSGQPAFSEEELKAAVEEAHKFNRTVFAHCEAYESIGSAVRAGVDVLEHCGFILPDGSRGFDEEAVKTMVEKKLFYDPTLQTGSIVIDTLKAKRDREGLTLSEKNRLESQEYKIKRKSENLSRMVEMGVQIVAGSDGIGLGNSTRLIRAMELMVDAGMTPMQVLVSATNTAAKALRLDHQFGSVKKGLKADIIAVKGNPSENISDLRKVKMVMLNGTIMRFEESRD